mgnify:CR=1 FL=1
MLSFLANELLHLLQKFGLLLELKSDSDEQDHNDHDRKIFLVPSMIPLKQAQEDEDATEPTKTEFPEFYLVFREPPRGGNGELTFDEAAKGFLPEGLFPRLLAKATNWHQHTATGVAQGGMRPVIFRDWARLAFGDHIFVVELLEAQQMIRVQLQVQNPTLVVGRIQEFVEEIKSECIPQLEYFIAVHIAPEAEGILIALERVQATIGAGGMTDMTWGADMTIPAEHTSLQKRMKDT